jgi:hypothetical protein
LAVPTLSGLATWRWRHGDSRVLVHDPALDAGQRFAGAGGGSRAIEGDRIRFAREVFGARPGLVAGVSRQADFVLIADVAAEMGYVLAAEFEGRGQICSGSKCLPGWNALSRVASAAGQGWAEALGSWAANPRGAMPSPRRMVAPRMDAGVVLGWVLVPRG